MPQNDPALEQLARQISSGLPAPQGGVRPLLEDLFGGRYHQRYKESSGIRDALALARSEGKDRVPFAGLINPDNAPSGPYGGFSLVWFPTEESGSLMAFVVGTRGLSPDEGILTRPGHRRRVVALRRYLARLGVPTWTKPDPAALGVAIPKAAKDRFAGFENAFHQYEGEIYCIAKVPADFSFAVKIVQAFFDLYAYERGWKVLVAFEHQYDEFHSTLREDFFTEVAPEEIYRLLRRRRFVVLQGPPGTGKTRLAEYIKRSSFAGRGMTVQFHPAITYEDFVVGLSPDPKGDTLRFRVRPGWLVQAAGAAMKAPYLLVIDEVNRADLGKVLGEAIFLFEPGEARGENPRRVDLAHPVNDDTTFSIPENLYVLATMNTADRSIANMDLAVRRRFAFVNVPPLRAVVKSQGLDFATKTFDQIADVFLEHAPDDALDLLPGHAYYLAKDDTELRERFNYELVPLLDEYLRQGLLGPASTDLSAVRDLLADAVR